MAFCTKCGGKLNEGAKFCGNCGKAFTTNASKVTNMKKLVMVFIMVLTVMANAFSQTEADFTVGLTEDGEGVVIKQYNGQAIQVRIPATIQGMPVKEIGNQAFGRGGGNIRPEWHGAIEITSVIIPNGITTIGQTAFCQQKKLTNITIPNTVTSIGKETFYGCTALVSITIPNSVTRIGDGAFEECSNLESITIPDNVTSIGDRAFARAGLKSIAWPASVTKIQANNTYGQMGMFTWCRNLQTMVIPEGVTEIGDYAFRGCSALTSVTFPSTIEKIGESAFSGCSALTTVNIPDAVEEIQFDRSNCFGGCLKLTLASQAALKRRGYTGSF
jgi:hypothetical protein